MNYWQKRMEKTQTAIADRTIKELQEQLKKYYSAAMWRTIRDFEATYEKVLNTIEDDRVPTPADLFALDKYWQMQGQLRDEMQKLGDKSVELLSKKFEEEWVNIYNSFSDPSGKAFGTISTDTAKAMVNSPWLPDGKTFSQRIWGNTEKLVETLNDNLMNCLITGKKPTELKKLLQERFNVSYNTADTLVRTEAAHIQTQAAAQRYQDYGLKYYEFLGREEHDIGCDCKKLDGKKFLYSEMVVGKNAPPLHPRCRCAIAPVVDNEREEIMNGKEFDEMTATKQYGYVKNGSYVYDVKDANGNKKTISSDEWKRISAKQTSEYFAKQKSIPLTKEQQQEQDKFAKFFDKNEDIISKKFDDATERFAYEIVKCPKCGHKFKSSTTGMGFSTCPRCGYSDASKYDANSRFEKRFVYEDADGHQNVLTSKSYNDKKTLERNRIRQAEQDEADRQELLKQQKRIEAKQRVADTDKGIDSEHAYSTAPFKRALKDAHNQEGTFEYYRYHCPECNRWFDSTSKNKKKCPVCDSTMEYSVGKRIQVVTKKCAHCGDLFDASNDTTKVLCDNCIRESLVSKEAIKLKKHGYTDKGIINVLTGTPDHYGREHKSEFDMYFEYISKHPEQKAEIDAIPYAERVKHFFICIDCGEVVYKKNIKDNASKRCPKCQAEYRRRYKAQHRKKKKN